MTRLASKVVALGLGLALAAPAFAAKVDRREAKQQARIAEGVKSGALTPKETVRLEKREAKIDAEIKSDRAANGGKLTPAERAKINAEQNRASRAISRQKHDGQVR